MEVDVAAPAYGRGEWPSDSPLAPPSARQNAAGEHGTGFPASSTFASPIHASAATTLFGSGEAGMALGIADASAALGPPVHPAFASSSSASSSASGQAALARSGGRAAMSKAARSELQRSRAEVRRLTLQLEVVMAEAGAQRRRLSQARETENMLLDRLTKARAALSETSEDLHRREADAAELAASMARARKHYFAAAAAGWEGAEDGAAAERRREKRREEEQEARRAEQGAGEVGDEEEDEDEEEEDEDEDEEDEEGDEQEDAAAAAAAAAGGGGGEGLAEGGDATTEAHQGSRGRTRGASSLDALVAGADALVASDEPEQAPEQALPQGAEAPPTDPEADVAPSHPEAVAALTDMLHTGARDSDQHALSELAQMAGSEVSTPAPSEQTPTAQEDEATKQGRWVTRSRRSRRGRA
jgi:hypothetical protein